VVLQSGLSFLTGSTVKLQDCELGNEFQWNRLQSVIKMKTYLVKATCSTR
jgi:hypothetical protein